MFDLDQMRSSVPLFLELWNDRPIKRNPGGMEFNHSWATWYLLARLKPDLIVESGIWRGHSTWLIERAAPQADIYSFDVDLSNRAYVSPRARYFEYDLEKHAWDGGDKAAAVAFIDDHQDAYQRMKTLHWLGFRRLIFEDNHPVGFGDFYSLKYLRAGVGYPVLPRAVSLLERARGRWLAARLQVRGSVRGRRPVDPNTYEWANSCNRIATYFEMPAVSLGGTNYYRGPSYAELGEPVVELLPDSTFKDEDLVYNWLTYIELHR